MGSVKHYTIGMTTIYLVIALFTGIIGAFNGDPGMLGLIIALPLMGAITGVIGGFLVFLISGLGEIVASLFNKEKE